MVGEAMGFMIDINIVIVSYNSKKVLEPCLISLLEDLKGSGLNWQITLVDNGSRDGTPAFVKEKFPDLKVVEQENVGYARGVNRGIRETDARYQFVLNPDTEIHEPNTVKHLVEWMDKHPKVGMAAPKLLNQDGTTQFSCGRFPKPIDPLIKRLFLSRYGWAKKRIGHMHMTDFDHQASQPVDWIMGSAMVARREALNGAGLMDERYFMYFEDMDCCRNMWESKWPVYYIHDIAMKHLHKRESAKIGGVKSVFLNPMTRMHLLSWWKYFSKHKFHSEP